jgi:predicted RND superfamily exporter protein
VTVARLLSALAGFSARRPLLVVATAVVLGLGGAALASGLHTSAATDTFVGRSSSDYQATQRFYRDFGEEPVEVMVSGNLQQLVLSSDIDRLVGLEGCLSGNVPRAALAKEGGVAGPCGELAKARTVKVVLGPGTFLNEAANNFDEQLQVQGKQAEAEAKQYEKTVYKVALGQHLAKAVATEYAHKAGKIARARYAESLAMTAVQYGLSSTPSLNNVSFISRVVFDNAAKRPGTPKQRFAYLFPSRSAALISVRLKAGLSESQRTRSIALIGQAVRMPQWHLTHGESYLVTGEPAIVSELTGSISDSLELLLVAVLVVMAVALSLIFRGRPRLLPLAIAVLAAALTFGALALVGGSLTVAQVAVLPVLVGLSVDYAIQFQSRFEETLAAGEGDRRVAVRRAATAGAPTIAVAAAASAGGLLVLMLSPVPMVRGFGLLLVVGIALAFMCALTVGSAMLVLSTGSRSPGLGSRFSGVAAQIGSAWQGAREPVLDNPLSRFVSRAALVHAVRHPGRVLGVGLVLAALGWGLDTQTRVETDITKLVPQNLPSLRNLTALEHASGVGGEIDMMVSSKTVASPKTIEWMSSYEAEVLKRSGYTQTHGCGQARLCPAFSLPDLFENEVSQSQTGASGQSGATGQTTAKAHKATQAGKGKLTQADITGLLGVIPPYFSQEVITPDRHVATLAFGLKEMSLSEQQHVIDQMRERLHPPKGVDVQLVGLPVLAARANAQVASPWRRMLTILAGLLAVALVLLIAFRGDRRRALVPLLPIVLATGWSALILFAVRVPLNPMSVTLGTLVIAISTEFSVLLAERHRQERLAGHSVVEALRRAYHHTGAAVVASGVTATAGFGVLVLSEIRMLRDLGLVTLVDLSVSLIGVLVVLPAALVLGERDRLPARGLSAALQWLRLRGRARHEPI